MLIVCPECGHNVSDKAVMCVSCGYPINNTKTITEAPKRRKYKRLPNGTGSIKLLKGNLRKPYAVYLPVKEYKDNGTPVQPKAIGYYATRTDALQALMEWHNHPDNVDIDKKTFKQVADEFLKDKHSKKVSDSTISNDKKSLKYVKAIHDIPMRSLVTKDIQAMFDSFTYKRNTQVQTLSLVHQVYKYALQNDYVEKDYSSFVKITQEDDEVSGIPFSENALKILWANRNDAVCRAIIIMSYTGYRKAAYDSMKYDLKEWYMQGGVKNKTSKDRIVPIHPDLQPLMNDYIENYFHSSKDRDKFEAKLKELGILYEPNEKGELQKHRVHDTRHTFSWICDKYKIDSVTKHMLMGHALGKDVEANTYGHRTLEELREAINLIKIIS